MVFELHMPFTTVLTTAQGEGSVCPTNASVLATGVARTAVWNYAQMPALTMDNVKEIDVLAKKGKCSQLIYISWNMSNIMQILFV